MSGKAKVAILISGGGSNMLSLLRAMAEPAYPAEPVLVLSNRPEAGGLAKAQAMGIKTEVLDHKAYANRGAFDATLSETLRSYQPDLLCFAGFMRILTADFVTEWDGKMLNIHPSLLPLFTGLNTHKRALEAGMAVHGATVHEVTADLDSGPILGQAVVPVLPGDTEDALAARVLAEEHRLYPEALRRFVLKEVLPFSIFPS